MSEKAVSIGNYVVATGIDTYLGVDPYTKGSSEVVELLQGEHGVKDYSNLLPGHGGMLDRFDSTIFTAPMLELLVLLAPAIAAVAQ